MTMKRIAAIACLSLAAPAAHAQLTAGQDCDEPIDVGGELLEVVGNVATLTGNVRVVQCGAVLSTTKLIGTQDSNGNYESLRAEGAVRYSNGEEAISSKKALYDLVGRTITFTDDVVVTQGKQVMTGGAVIYWLDTGKIRFTAPEGERVRGIFHTNSLNAQL
ncbi:MAG: LptA/OstA family protein [Pseudomonadota bacterium]